MPPSFVAVGELMLDLEIEPGAHAHAGRIALRVGGSAANAAVWAASAGAIATCVGRVGSDAAALAVNASLAERGVAARLAADPLAPTGTVARVGGELVVDRGANARLLMDDVLAAAPADALLVSGYALFHDDTAPAARAALEGSSARWRGVDCGAAGLLAGLTAAVALERASRANVLFANEEEAAILSPGASPEDAARSLGDRFELVCVKLGAAGAIAVLDGRLVGNTSENVHAGPARGAGDAFAAGVLVELARGGGLERALALGCALGSHSAGSPDGWPMSDS